MQCAPERSVGTLLAVIAFVASAGLVSAQDDDLVEAVPLAARLQLESLEGEVTERVLDGLHLTDPRAEGAVFVRYSGLDDPPPLDGDPTEFADVELVSGDRIRGRVRAGDGDLLQLELAGGAAIELSIDEIAAIVFAGRLPADGAALPVPAEAGDRLYRRSGRGTDRVDGLLQSFSTAGVSFESRLGEKLFPWREVAALFVEALEPDLGQAAGGASTGRVPVVVDLHGESRIRGDLVAIEGAGCRIATLGSPELFLPAEVVREIAVDDGSFRFLSALEPDDAGPQSPFDDDLGFPWPHRMDRAVRGGPLRANGRIWSRGIGVHAPSRLTWNLAGAWSELRAHAAIDDQVLSLPERGSVIFRVIVDGETRYESPVLRGGEPALRLPAISLEGATELVLEVDAAGTFVADRANWLRPILVRLP